MLYSLPARKRCKTKLFRDVMLSGSKRPPEHVHRNAKVVRRASSRHDTNRCATASQRSHSETIRQTHYVYECRTFGYRILCTVVFFLLVSDRRVCMLPSKTESDTLALATAKTTAPAERRMTSGNSVRRRPRQHLIMYTRYA